MREQLPRVLSFPFQPRFLLSSYPELMGKVLGIDVKGFTNAASAWMRRSGRSPIVSQWARSRAVKFSPRAAVDFNDDALYAPYTWAKAVGAACRRASAHGNQF